MKRWKRRCRGAISIFLIIIFIANFTMIGVLVDAGRYRMAKASAEMALDSATGSVLSYYNKMVYDLYGLFATDSLSNEKITELLNDYVSKTLAVTGVEQSTATALTQVIQSAMNTAAGEDLPEFDGYDYQVEVELAEEDSVTLANTEMVEDQIIEHMKYRAPMAMVDETGSFLSKLEGLANIIDRVKVSVDKSKSNADETKRDLAERAAALLDDIEKHNREVLNFTVYPYDEFGTLQAGPNDTAKRLLDFVDMFDEDVDETANLPQYNDGTTEEEQEADKAALRTAYEGHINELVFIMSNIQTKAEELHKAADSIRDRMESLIDDYDAYIATLQAKIDADPSNQNLKTVYEPEIQLAQSTCGELVKNIDLVLMSRQYLRSLYAYQGDPEYLRAGASAVVDHRMGDPNQDTSAYLGTLIGQSIGTFGPGLKTYFSEAQSDFNALNVFARDFEEAKDVEIDVEDTEKEETPKESGTEELRDLDKDDLKVEYQETDTGTDEPLSLSGEANDNSQVTALLENGLNLLEKLVNLLESARDSLYINEYAIAYFPNYVQHYNATSKAIATGASNKYLIAEDSYYKAFNASQAELEYILTGVADADGRVAAVYGMLTGFRLVLNLAAIFTDSAKIAQANAMAAAISGPFAPLVSFGLLVAWAVAESALDAADLMDGEDVFFFKQGANWSLSAGGAVKELISEATEVLVEEGVDLATDMVNKASASVQQFTNQAIYDAYQVAKDAVEGTVDAAAKAGQEMVDGWADELVSKMPAEGQSLAQELADAGKGRVNENIQNLADTGMEYADQAILKANDAIQSGVKNVTDTINKHISDFGDQAAEAITNTVSSALEKYIPQGTVTSTGSNTEGFNVTLNYMDYMRIFLLLTGNTTKVERIQSLVQANVRYQASTAKGEEDDSFSMAGSYGSVAATLKGSIKFLLLGEAVMPAGVKQDGRMAFTVYSHRGY